MSLKSAIHAMLTKPGYELRKYRVQRWWQRKGIHIEMAQHAKFSYDRCNFQGVPEGDGAVIFDVGANVGQSSVWFNENFPHASIYAFEPFAIVFNRMKKTVVGRSKVRIFQTAIGKMDGKLQVDSVRDAYYQCGQIIPASGKQANTETVNVRSLDSFCVENKINQIHILKSDTEGFDLDVLRGAEGLLKAGRIGNVLAEASITEGDNDHTNLFELREFLRPYSFTLHAVYDLHHGKDNGQLEYFNALFQLKKK